MDLDMIPPRGGPRRVLVLEGTLGADGSMGDGVDDLFDARPAVICVDVEAVEVRVQAAASDEVVNRGGDHQGRRYGVDIGRSGVVGKQPQKLVEPLLPPHAEDLGEFVLLHLLPRQDLTCEGASPKARNRPAMPPKYR